MCCVSMRLHMRMLPTQHIPLLVCVYVCMCVCVCVCVIVWVGFHVSVCMRACRSLFLSFSLSLSLSLSFFLSFALLLLLLLLSLYLSFSIKIIHHQHIITFTRVLCMSTHPLVYYYILSSYNPFAITLFILVSLK